jgi:dTDP-3-amino-3,4,6-trideoxy-alpha-D-glucopyranose N,N-dimethyltransferase
MDRLVYEERAELYDLIYDWKDYEAEARVIRQLLDDEGIAEGSHLLDAATGTGRHLDWLGRWYSVAGFDISPAMLDIARRRLPEIELFVGDMATFQVDRPFDAVVSLFSSVGYLESEQRLSDAARRFAAALRPGGVLVLQPWFTPEEAIDGVSLMDTYQSDEITLCRMSDGRVVDRRSVLEFHWLVGRPGRGVESFVELHELSLFSHQQMVDALEGAGLETRFDPRDLGGRPGLYVGKKA